MVSAALWFCVTGLFMEKFSVLSLSPLTGRFLRGLFARDSRLTPPDGSPFGDQTARPDGEVK